MNDLLDIRLDWQRGARTGVPEAIYCAGKPAATLLRILLAAQERQQRLLLTRLEADVLERLAAAGAPPLDYDPLSRTGIFGLPAPPTHAGEAAVVCAGSSDLPVATEAVRALEFLGAPGPLFADVGVAGLWRLLDIADELRRFRAIIVVAGMEGALFSVVAGLVPAPVVAVPTSIGYGVAEGGKAALSSALASCAPGVVAVNIDNGFGAAAAVVKMLAAAGRQPVS
jgi:NCAIR mutase (PurE)-related protein